MCHAPSFTAGDDTGSHTAAPAVPVNTYTCTLPSTIRTSYNDPAAPDDPYTVPGAADHVRIHTTRVSALAIARCGTMTHDRNDADSRRPGPLLEPNHDALATTACRARPLAS